MTQEQPTQDPGAGCRFGQPDTQRRSPGRPQSVPRSYFGFRDSGSDARRGRLKTQVGSAASLSHENVCKNVTLGLRIPLGRSGTKW